MSASVSLSRRSRFSRLSRLRVLAVVAGMPAAAHGRRVEAAPPAPAAVVVSGQPHCPDAAALNGALNGLLPSPGGDEGPDVLQLSRGRDGIDVRLFAPGGALIGEKSLATSGTCEERAQTVAVLVAAWETRWRPGPPAALPGPKAVAETEGPPPAVAPPSAPVPAALAPRGLLVGTVAVRDQAAPLQLETRAGLLMSITGASVAPAVTCDVGVARRDLPFAIAVGVLAVGSHDVPVGQASARWRRIAGTIEVRSRRVSPSFGLEMHAAAALSALSVSGVALPVTSGATLFDPGLVVGLRGQLRAVQLAPWVEASAALWPRTHIVYVKGATDARDLPSFEVFLGAGVAFGAQP